MQDLKMQLPNRLAQAAKAPSSPTWVRVSAWGALIVFQVSLFAAQLSHISVLSKASNTVYVWGSGLLDVIAATVIVIFGIQELRRAGQATGKHGFLAQMAYILLRTFLFVLLPCMVITLLLVVWGILTHQPAFR